MYEAGWKKKLTYIFAFSEFEIVDVILRYTRQVADVNTRRNLADPFWLHSCTQELQNILRVGCSQAFRDSLNVRHLEEIQEFINPPHRPLGTNELKGRTSGSKEWRLARGETQSVPIPIKSMSIDQAFFKKILNVLGI